MRIRVFALVSIAGCGRLAFDALPADVATSNVPSCAGRPPTCGPTHDADCCAALPVPGGSFFRGRDVATDNMFTSMTYPATVSSFHLDKYEVTVGRFRQFVLAGMGTQSTAPSQGEGVHPNLAGSGWQASWNVNLMPDTPTLVSSIPGNCRLGAGPTPFTTWTDAPAGNENRPMQCIDWYEAFAFCIWDGGYLPTVAELMYAASGGSQQRAYPWSMPSGDVTITPNHASYSDGVDCVGDGQAGCSVTDLVEVGALPAGDGAWGHSDLAGNVSELVIDWTIATNQFPNPCTDCAQVTDPGTARRVSFEGAYGSTVDLQRSAGLQFTVLPVERWHNVGFRCARP